MKLACVPGLAGLDELAQHPLVSGARTCCRLLEKSVSHAYSSVHDITVAQNTGIR